MLNTRIKKDYKRHANTLKSNNTVRGDLLMWTNKMAFRDEITCKKIK
jgi:hypothetical protein